MSDSLYLIKVTCSCEKSTFPEKKCCEKIVLWKSNTFKKVVALKKQHCVKTVRIRSYSDPDFPESGLTTERLSPNAGKYGEEKLRIGTLFTQRSSLKK